MRGEVNKFVSEEAVLLLPNLVPHSVPFHITVLVGSKNETEVKLLFAAISVCSVILASI